MFPRLILKSLRQRPGRAVLIVLTLVMGLSLEAALLNLSLDIGNKSEQELKAFGSNILLLPRDEIDTSSAELTTGNRVFIPQTQLSSLDTPGDIPLEGYVPFLYSLAEVNGQRVAVSGTVFDKALKINPWWSIRGEAPARGGKGVVLGEELAMKLNVNEGGRITIRQEGRLETLAVVGVLSTGGSEDNQVLMDLDLAQSITGLPEKVSAVQVSVPTGGDFSVDEIAASLEEQLPGVRARTVKQVTEAGQNLLGKINMLMGLVTTLIIFISAVTVSASLANAVIERRCEIGLMKALGAEGRGIAAIILGEALLLSALAGPAGYLLGLMLAQVVGLSVFDTTVSFHLRVIPIVIVSAGLLAIAASLMPVRRALSIEPAVILRGE